MHRLEEENIKLLAKASEIIEERFKEGFHEIGCALRTKDGNIYSAIHLEAYVGRIAICAEAIAIGMAAADGDVNIDTIVAVDPYGEVVSPCGMCRELISDYSKDAKVIVNKGGTLQVIPITELLPLKFNRS